MNSGSLSDFLTSNLFSQTFSLPPNEPPCSLVGLPYLWSTYTTYVDFTLKVLHIPSTQLLIDKALSSAPQISKGAYCIIAAIKFAAVTVLKETNCQNAFHTGRQALLEIFRQELQCALRAAGFLVSQDLATLQAFIIFLVR